ncbi:large ribosomal subunit protein mL50 [Neodiprion pinetum]|uniref:39S ribosomal protein L50, mitochondrial n=1 Tax=Neodiprion fabricii TaxID=2872261 RepID=UPI001ED949F8|nr:39S ribosomal protein L50, mitochondrial [Neodiprion fabricii]XP_046485259.1 39S ribosomal protein L50, mitochondrial [Neodiprion pinetum]XP_046622914.1 39S ribosomal protein L50, mitochondrial [Neodiprion virginianus]
MAALIRHAWQASSSKYSTLLRSALTGGTTDARRDFAAVKKFGKKKKNEKESRFRKTINLATLQAERESLATRGYLRPQKSYSPATDVMERLDKVCHDEGLKIVNETRLDEPIVRYKLFTACGKEFSHAIPNSLLHTVETIADLRKFYLTPVNATVPLDAMRDQNLPENLHIQYEYHRFIPETDTMFGGKTAFPKSSTLVTGLKYKKKYPGHTAKTSWP